MKKIVLLLALLFVGQLSQADEPKQLTDVVLVHPGQPHPMYKNSTDYLIDRLLK